MQVEIKNLFSLKNKRGRTRDKNSFGSSSPGRTHSTKQQRIMYEHKYYLAKNINVLIILFHELFLNAWPLDIRFP